MIKRKLSVSFSFYYNFFYFSPQQTIKWVKCRNVYRKITRKETMAEQKDQENGGN